MKTALDVDIYRHISLHIATFKIFHVWFFISHPKTSYKFWLTAVSQAFIAFLVFFIAPVTQVVYFVRMIASGLYDIQDIASAANLMLSEVQCSMKLLDIRLRRESFKDMMDQLQKFPVCYQEKHKKIIEKSIKLSRLLFTVLMVVAFFDVFVHVVVKSALKSFKALPMNMDFIFFNAEDPAYFNYVMAYQFLYKPTMIATYVTILTLGWACISCATSQLDVLINKLENMKELVKITMAENGCEENEAFEMILREVILHYAAIKRFAKTLQALLSGQLAMTLFTSASILGTTLMQILTIESPKENIADWTWVLAYLCINMGSLFCDCHFGDALTEKSLKLATAAFGCPWVYMPTKLKRNVIIFMANTQQPLELIMVKLIPVSIQMFTKVMNWTYKGFAVMNQMKK